MQWEINWRTFFSNFFIGLVVGLLVEYFAYGHWQEILLYVPFSIGSIPIPVFVYLIPVTIFGIYVTFSRRKQSQ